MDIINQIVDKLSKDELRYLNMRYATDDGDERKDLMLLNLVRKQGEKFDEDKTLKQLGYSQGEKNSYYRLKNRVIADIGEGLSLLYTSKNEGLELQHYLALFSIYYGKQLYKVCLYYLKRAEKLANAIESYEQLDIVYDGIIRLSFHLTEINPSAYSALRRSNMQLVSALRELDDYLADVSYRLKLTQNFGAADKKLLRSLSEKAKEIAARTTSHYSRNLQTRIYRALGQVFIQQHNYTELEELVKNSFALFEKEKWFDKDNHDLKLQMLTHAGNALYKNGKLKESLQYAELLGDAILQYSKLHYDRFLFFYINLQILNNSALNPTKALEHLNSFEQEMRKKKNYYHDTFIYLNRAGLLYDMKRYKEALKALVKLYLRDEYAKANKAFKLKVEVSELIITFEAGDKAVLLGRIAQVDKDYAQLLGQKDFSFDQAIINLLKDMAQAANYRRDKDIQTTINKLLATKQNPEHEDSEIIKYKGWLAQKTS
jgi:hypothetical protein